MAGTLATRLCMVIGVMLVAAGIAVLLHYHHERDAYAQLAREVADDREASKVQEEGAEATPAAMSNTRDKDWAMLTAINKATVAWVRVDGCDIDLPVVMQQPDDRDHWLTHDFWGHPAIEGTPYLDHRCKPHEGHRLVYGHHLNVGGQFSSLQHAYEQEVFDGLGTLHWSTPQQGELRLQPLCAMRVASDYAPIQRTSFANDESRATWLSTLVGEATAYDSCWEQCFANTHDVVTLVTCSSDFPGQPWRTLVLFINEPQAP